uniref:Basic helix-loop-helix family protein n=1 Tax=Rhizophora mucronata TaxID=61149 RepID=A0A2P2NAB2_RHIMU
MERQRDDFRVRFSFSFSFKVIRVSKLQLFGPMSQLFFCPAFC